MASPNKRQRPTEFDNFSSIPSSPSPTKAKLHGVVTTLSPLKDKRENDPSKVPFFHGTMNDEVKKLKLVGFGKALQNTLSRSQ